MHPRHEQSYRRPANLLPEWRLSVKCHTCTRLEYMVKGPRVFFIIFAHNVRPDLFIPVLFCGEKTPLFPWKITIIFLQKLLSLPHLQPWKNRLAIVRVRGAIMMLAWGERGTDRQVERQTLWSREGEETMRDWDCQPRAIAVPQPLIKTG